MVDYGFSYIGRNPGMYKKLGDHKAAPEDAQYVPADIIWDLDNGHDAKDDHQGDSDPGNQ